MENLATSVRCASVTMLCALCLLLIGCGQSKITKESFDKIENGMSLQEVERLLGSKGTPQGGETIAGAAAGVDLGSGAKQSSTVEYKWESGNKWIQVGIRGDKVSGKTKAGL